MHEKRHSAGEGGGEQFAVNNIMTWEGGFCTLLGTLRCSIEGGGLYVHVAVHRLLRSGAAVLV